MNINKILKYMYLSLSFSPLTLWSSNLDNLDEKTEKPGVSVRRTSHMFEEKLKGFNDLESIEGFISLHEDHLLSEDITGKELFFKKIKALAVYLPKDKIQNYQDLGNLYSHYEELIEDFQEKGPYFKNMKINPPVHARASEGLSSFTSIINSVAYTRILSFFEKDMKEVFPTNSQTCENFLKVSQIVRTTAELSNKYSFFMKTDSSLITPLLTSILNIFVATKVKIQDPNLSNKKKKDYTPVFVHLRHALTNIQKKKISDSGTMKIFNSLHQYLAQVGQKSITQTLKHIKDEDKVKKPAVGNLIKNAGTKKKNAAVKSSKRKQRKQVKEITITDPSLLASSSDASPVQSVSLNISLPASPSIIETKQEKAEDSSVDNENSALIPISSSNQVIKASSNKKNIKIEAQGKSRKLFSYARLSKIISDSIKAGRLVVGNQHRQTLRDIFDGKLQGSKLTTDRTLSLLNSFNIKTSLKNGKGSHNQLKVNFPNGETFRDTWAQHDGSLHPENIKNLREALERNGITPEIVEESSTETENS